MIGLRHEIAGLVLGLLCCALLVWQGHPIIGIACLFLALWGANLPELIDPIRNPFPRAVGHNFASLFLFGMVCLASIGVSYAFKDSNIVLGMFAIMAAFSAGVVAHLLLDMMAKKGLPLFTGRSLLGLIRIPLFLVPVVNVVLLISTAVSVIDTVRTLSKKMGGRLALIIVLIPLWIPFLIAGLALVFANYPDISTYPVSIAGYILGGFSLVMLLVIIMGILLLGKTIDRFITKKSSSVSQSFMRSD